MVDPVRLILLLNYYYGRLMGVINFEIDIDTGMARASKKATLYAALINISVFSMMPLLVKINAWFVYWKDLNSFHEYIIMTSLALRNGCVLATILNRWWQRRQIISLMGKFRRLILEQPSVVHLWRHGVILKFTTGVLTEVVHFLAALSGLQQNITLSLTVVVIIMAILVALLNIILSQYYFAILNIHGHYVLINEEFRLLVWETRSLELDHRKGVKILRSCDLADRIDKLACFQFEVQSLIHRMTRIFGLQTICIGIIFYISMISSFYGTFVFIKLDLKNKFLFNWEILLLIIGLLCYHADMYITFSIVYHLEDQHAILKHLTEQNTSFAPDLDVRLQNALDSFHLQLICNPLNLSVMGLYSIKRTGIVAMFHSILTHSIILIQYDIKNF